MNSLTTPPSPTTTEPPSSSRALYGSAPEFPEMPPDDRPLWQRFFGRRYYFARRRAGRAYWAMRGFVGRQYWRLRSFFGRGYWKAKSLVARARCAVGSMIYRYARAPYQRLRYRLLCWKCAVQCRVMNFFWRRSVLLNCARAVQLLLLPVYLVVLIRCCRDARKKRQERIARGEKPRLVWGPYPNYSTTEIARAMRARGYVCDSIIYYNFSRIWKSDAFKYCLADDLARHSYIGGQFLKLVYYHFRVFINIVYDYDVVHGVFYAGFLRDTLFERFEVQLLHLAGCKMINTTIGGDVAVTTDIESHVIRQGLNDMYAYSTRNAEQDSVKRWIRYWSEHSDFIICQCSYMIDCLPRWDLLVTQYFPIDTDYWVGTGYRDADGRNAPVRIGHSPNHRPLKGSNFLIRAVNELRAEGLKIELVMLENHQNSVVRDILREVDIIMADIVLQGYAVMGTEGCALGKPVIQDISDPHYNRVFKLYTGLDEAPFVSTPIEGLKEKLRELVVNPALREEIGRQSRAYALKYHSYEANARFWEWVYEYVWFNRRERVAFYHPDWPLETLTSLNQVQLTEAEKELKSSIEAVLAPHRGAQGLQRIAFDPFNEQTAPLVQHLIRSRAIHSDDYLVIDEGGTPPASARHYTQAVVPRSRLADYGLTTVCRLPSSSLEEAGAAGLAFTIDVAPAATVPPPCRAAA